MVPELWKSVVEGSEGCFKEGEFWIKSQEEEHGEEKDGPQPADRQLGESGGVSHKSQTLTTFRHVLDVHSQLFGLKAKLRSNSRSCVLYGIFVHLIFSTFQLCP